MRTGSTVRSLREALASELRRARESRGISQEKLAALCDLHRTYISLLERSLRSPTIDVLERIAAGLGETTSALLAEAEKNMEGRKRG
jgi:transcriptional regulator with XRE-family HTH domain